MRKHHLLLLFLSSILIFGCKQTKNKEVHKEVHKEVKKVNPVSIDKPEKPFVFGIDISHYNNNEVDLLSKSKDSIQFIICKATEGISYIDPKFKSNWNAIKERGFIRGAYHFYRTQDDPIAQANHFLKAIVNIEKNDIPPIVDFEEGGIDKLQSTETLEANLLTFIKIIEEKGNVTPIIYTSFNCGNRYLKNPVFNKYPLWIADYNGKEQPDLPKIWLTKNYFIWQKTDDYKIVNGTDDADIFNGTLTQFKTFIKNSYH